MPVEPGRHILRVTVSGQHVASASFVAPEGGELLALLVPVPGGGSNLVVLTLPKRPTDSATLQLIQASALGTIQADVGSDDARTPDFALAPGAVAPSAGAAMDPTRPSLAFVDNGRTTTSFSLPRPAIGEFLAGVVLGDPNREAEDPNALRLLLVGDKSAVLVKPDPVVHVLHLSAGHAGLDVFATRRNPLTGFASDGVEACSLDLRPNEALNLAQLADDLRFGALASAGLPPGPAAFQIFLTIPKDADPPSALHFDLVNALVPNQRLRDGFAIGCAGAQIEPSAELVPGGEYLMLLPSGRLQGDNRTLTLERKTADERLRIPPLAPRVPLSRISRQPLEANEFELSLAVGTSVGVTDEVSVELPKASLSLKATGFTSTSGRWIQSDVLRLPAARQEISVVFGTRLRRTVVIDPSPGSRLLVLAAGYPQPPASTPDANPRADDIDADGFVASAIDPNTGALVTPNYLPPDGDISLKQDDCPNEPGPIWGCPAAPLTWMVLDTTNRTPVLQTLRAE
ncbi:MAG: hypothetical protein ACOY0T_20765 [Myxococcota bacterium]